MKKSIIEFNYDNLQSMDMVCCAGRSPFAAVTRIVTSGWKNAFKHDIAVHTGMIFDLNGQKVIAEMQSNGLELNSLERYNRVGGRRWVIAIRRHQAFSGAMKRNDAQQKIAIDLRRTLKYDYKGLVEFVSNRVKDNPKRAYCSEYYYQICKEVAGSEIAFPEEYETKVSPRDLQTCAGFYSVANAFRIK